MRHQEILEKDSYSRVDVAAVWPVGVQIAPPPIPDADATAPSTHAEPTPSTPDVPASVGLLIVASYASLIAAFAIATVGSAQSWYAITISALFVVAFFTVPRIIFGIEPSQGARPDFDQFMAEGMETLTGHSSGGAALVQMLIVPVSLTIGILAIAVAISFIL